MAAIVQNVGFTAVTVNFGFPPTRCLKVEVPHIPIQSKVYVFESVYRLLWQGLD